MSKNLGVFYTPHELVEFVKLQLEKTIDFSKVNSILEPSAGDGRFIESILKMIPEDKLNIKLIEIDTESCRKLREKFVPKYKNIVVNNDDFLFSKLEKRKYDLIIGNPPYISKSRLEREQITQLRNILTEFDIPHSADKNIWTSFILKCERALSIDGVMTFVLPFDLLQVKFSESIQNFLERNFERIDIYTFQSLVFRAAGQDTVLLVAHKRHKSPGLYIYDVDSITKEKRSNEPLLLTRQACRKSTAKSNGVKWSSLVLSDCDIEFLNSLYTKLSLVDNYLISRPGLVTAANDFFIIDSERLQEFGLQSFSKPVVQKGLYVKNKLVFSKRDYDELIDTGLPGFFLDFNNYTQGTSSQVDEYLAFGEQLGIHNRFKCRNREFWYKVPMVPPGDGFFFKRSSEYPKLLKNESKVYSTDSAYNIFVKLGYDINSVIYSYYNPLTMCFAELFGRYYGGGVLELIPSEFKRLPLPYTSISLQEFESFKKDFDEKSSIVDILDKYGRFILKDALCISDSDIDRILIIYRSLVNRRLNKSITR